MRVGIDRINGTAARAYSSRRRKTTSSPPGFIKSVREHFGHSTIVPISRAERAIARSLASMSLAARTRVSDLMNF